MPELPEVQTVVDTLNRALHGGRRVIGVTHLRDDMVVAHGLNLRVALAGRAIADVWRRGKRIVLQLDDGNHMYLHLGMTGRLTVEPGDKPRRLHTHMVLTLSDGREIRFVDPRRFGAIVWLGANVIDGGELGPEPLTIRPREFADRMLRTRRAIKTALLDQRLIAGIGNIYADEALFAAAIHPATPASRLSAEQVRRLCMAVRRVLGRAIRHGGSTLRDYVDANGAAGRFRRLHHVYDREGDPCPHCGRPIKRIVLGGRSTHFCGTCQAAPKRTRRSFATE